MLRSCFDEINYTTFLKRADHDALCRFFPLLHRETENANWTAIATTRWGFVLAFHWNRFYFIKKIPWWRASRYRNSFTWGIVRFQQVITFKIPAKLLQHLLISHIFSILSLTLQIRPFPPTIDLGGSSQKPVGAFFEMRGTEGDCPSQIG